MVTAPAPVVTARFARPIRDPMLSSVSPSPKREILSPSRSASRSRSRSAPAPRPNAVEAAPPLSVLAKAEPTRPSIECSDRPPPRRHWHQAEPGSRCPVPKRPSSRRHRSLHPQSGNRPRAAEQAVAARPAVKPVIAVAALDSVVSCAGMDRVVAPSPSSTSLPSADVVLGVSRKTSPPMSTR